MNGPRRLGMTCTLLAGLGLVLVYESIAFSQPPKDFALVNKKQGNKQGYWSYARAKADRENAKIPGPPAAAIRIESVKNGGEAKATVWLFKYDEASQKYVEDGEPISAIGKVWGESPGKSERRETLTLYHIDGDGKATELCWLTLYKGRKKGDSRIHQRVMVRWPKQTVVDGKRTGAPCDEPPTDDPMEEEPPTGGGSDPEPPPVPEEPPVEP